MPYLGASPPAVFSAPTKDVFSGNGETKDFTLGKSAGGANAIEVFVENVRQEPNVAYTVNDKTLTFTSAPASGSSNIYVINKSTIIGNGLIPVPGRDSDRVTTMTVDGNLNTKGNIAGNVLHPITLDGTDGSSSNAGDNLILDGTDSSSSNTGDMILHEINTDDINKVGQVDTTNFQFDNNVLVKGNVEVQGNLVSPTAGGRVTIESGTDATTGFILLDSSAASTDVGEQILFEDGTNDPTSYYNNDLVAFSNDVKIGDEVTANSVTTPTIRKNTASPSFTLPSADGTSGQAIITDASGNLSFGDAGGGKILQVVSTRKNDSFSRSSNSYAVVTGLTADITPAATSSKVLIMVTAPYSGTNGSANVTLFKGGSNLIDDSKDSGLGSRTGCFHQNGNPESGANEQMNPSTYTFLDSPNTTSQITYEVHAKASSGTIRINNNNNPDNITARPCSVSTITLMEIDGS